MSNQYSSSDFQMLNKEEFLESRDWHFSRLNRLFNGESLEKPLFLNGIYGEARSNPYINPEEWMKEALHNLCEQANLILDTEVFRPLCVEFGPYGVHFIDRIFGAEIVFNEDSKEYFNKELNVNVGELRTPILDGNKTWGLAKRAALEFLNHEVKLPLLGMPTISSPLNIGVNLYGERILAALCTEKERARHDLEVITALLCEIHQWYINNVPKEQLQPVVSAHRTQPFGYGQICGCTTQLLSPQLYEQFVADLDCKILSLYPNGGMIHLCGQHTQHLSTWRNMKSLRAIQINDRAAEDLEIYLKELRDDQIIYLNPTQTMTAQKALNITGGRRLVVVSDTVMNS